MNEQAEWLRVTGDVLFDNGQIASWGRDRFHRIADQIDELVDQAELSAKTNELWELAHASTTRRIEE